MKEFLGFSKGDIITLSDIQTQKDFNEMTVDFKIIETRIYREPKNFFVYTGYIFNYQSPDNDEPIKMMILIRQVGDDSDVMVYFLDNEGSASDFIPLFTEDKKDLINRFEVTIHADKDIDVTWDKKNDESTFGVLTQSSETGSDHKTLAEYFTNDDAAGNPHAFVEWTGDIDKGWLEIWYGCEARKEDIEFFHTITTNTFKTTYINLVE